MFFRFQPAGNPVGKLPYPYFTDNDGAVLRQDVWRGQPERIVGFTDRHDAEYIVLTWTDFLADPQRVVGLYMVTEDSSGGFSTESPHLEEVGTGQTVGDC